MKTVQKIKSRIWEMKGGKYAKTLAKIQVRGIFNIRDIGRNVLPKFIDWFVWRRHARAHPDEHQHGGRKPTETSVIEFCYKSVNLFFEELINIKVILFLIHELFRWQNFLKYVILLTYMTALLAVMRMRVTGKSLEIQAYSITKPRTLLRRKFVWTLVFSCSNASWK